MIEKNWTLISILFLVVILLTLLFWPEISRLAGLTVMIVCTTFVIAFTVRRNVQAYRQEIISHSLMIRNSIIDVLGLLVTIVIAFLLAGRAVPLVSQFAGSAAEKVWPGKGMTAAILAGTLAAILVGSFAGLLVRWIWGSLRKPRRT